MLKTKMMVILLVMFLSINCISNENEYYIDNIPSTHFGIWIPKIFDDDFKTTFTYSNSNSLKRTKKAHDILIVDSNRISSDLGFNDGYAITKTEYQQFKLENKKGNITLFDQNGNEYLRIGKGNNYSEVFSNYIMAIINKKVASISSKIALIFSENVIYIASQVPELGPYELVLNMTFMYRNDIQPNDYNIILYNRKQNIFYGMKINTDSVSIDQFIERTSLLGNVIQSSEVEKVTVFIMK